MSVPVPPDDLDPAIVVLPTGSDIHRIHSKSRPANVFNPGLGKPTRFAFFGSPSVPVLYAGGSHEIAVAETLLHDMPSHGGVLLHEQYRDRASSILRTSRPLRLVNLRGLALRRLKLSAPQITDTSPLEYPQTVRWAEALHGIDDIDGIVWTSRQCNDGPAYVLFGTRVKERDLVPQADRVDYDTPNGMDMLAALTMSLHVRIMPGAVH